MADMTTRTWEEAAQEAACGIPEDYVPLQHGDTILDEIDFYLDALRDGTRFADEAFRWIADDALEAYEQHFAAKDGVVTRDELIDETVETIIRKQHDYGHDNILWGGLPGLVLRMHDKTARIRNLQERLHAGPLSGGDVAPMNESLADSWLDLVGYSIIGLMLENGTFELPLARDLLHVGAAADPSLMAKGAAHDFVNAFLEGDCESEEYVHDELSRDGFEDVEPDDEWIFDDEDTYDELTDDTLWHLPTEHQDVLVGTYIDGWGDGEARVFIGTRGQNETGDVKGAYFTVEELARFTLYLNDIESFLRSVRVTRALSENVVVAP